MKVGSEGLEMFPTIGGLTSSTVRAGEPLLASLSSVLPRLGAGLDIRGERTDASGGWLAGFTPFSAREAN